jgi:hypothetical protein
LSRKKARKYFIMGTFSPSTTAQSLRLVGYDSRIFLSEKFGEDITSNTLNKELSTSNGGSTISGLSGAFVAPNVYDGTLNLQGDTIETTVKGDFPWRSYRAGFKDATINLSLRNDAKGADVQFLRQRALDGSVFLLLLIDNYKHPEDGWISLPVVATTANTAGDFQSSQDLTFELKPSITTTIGYASAGSWGEYGLDAGDV